MAFPKLLITGCNGQLGRELMAHFSSLADVTGFDIDDVDIVDRLAVGELISTVAPDVVLHAAAYTDVDGAEAEPERAMAINADGSRNVALACRETGARLVYYSTDYVFPGNSGQPYVESDLPDPINVYGRSKWEGERLVSEIADDSVIMRIAWLYSHGGSNFINTILKIARERVEASGGGAGPEPLLVVNDQTGCPTWTREVARQTETMIRQELVGIFHASSEGQATWFEFASAAIASAGLAVPFEPCTTSEFPRPAPRPAFSVLENARLKELGLNRMADWRSALNEFFATQPR